MAYSYDAQGNITGGSSDAANAAADAASDAARQAASSTINQGASALSPADKAYADSRAKAASAAAQATAAPTPPPPKPSDYPSLGAFSAAMADYKKKTAASNPQAQAVKGMIAKQANAQAGQ
jgi:hypothetical protein